MIKKYTPTLIITLIVILFPMLVGILLWDRLPMEMATHFQFDGTADKFNSKTFVVFIMPLMMSFLQLVAMYFTLNDPKKKNMGEKMLKVVFWIIPLVTLFTHLSIYANAMEIGMDISAVSQLAIGVILVLMGNYLPKTKQNYTVGIRTPWTLNDEENWNKTHRVGAWTFVICGLLMIVNIFIKSQPLMFVALALLMIPVLYSFLLYKKNK
ncbi:SdpI family protein [Filifactor villosus]|uniref:SdpI family protein n=1 Tax=Filifactor villosus TaxID=29374 RepID=A0ABV9QPK1_9FIRM